MVRWYEGLLGKEVREIWGGKRWHEGLLGKEV